MRDAAHGGYVAESAGEAAVAYGIGRVPVAPEMDFFEAEVGGHEHFVAAWETKEGAVVADALTFFIAFIACPPGGASPNSLY
jgi:hypothetical protein